MEEGLALLDTPVSKSGRTHENRVAIPLEMPLDSPPPPRPEVLDEPPDLDKLQIDEVEPPVIDNPAPSPQAAKPAAHVAPSGMESPRVGLRNGNSRPTEPARARAEEVNPGSKVVPKVEIENGDYFGLAIELEAWFSLAHQWTSYASTSQWFDQLNDDHALKRLFKDLHGSVPSAVAEIVTRVTDLGLPITTVHGLLPSDDFNDHTLLFVYLCAQIETKNPLLDRGTPIITRLIGQIASMRWMINTEDEDDDKDSINPRAVLPRLLILARLAIIATLGDSDKLRTVHNEVWKSYGLETPEDGSGEYASPINYAMYMDDIIKRYPAYMHPPDEHHVLGSQLRDSINGVPAPFEDPTDPAELVNNQRVSTPYVPDSIVEACNLFKSHVRATPQLLQLHEEQLRANKLFTTEKGSTRTVPKEVEEVKKIYQQTLDIQKSFIRVIVDILVVYGHNQGSNVVTHAALATVCLLMRWFEVSHIMMFEHVSAILFDCQFHFVTHVFCQLHPRILNEILGSYTMTGGSVFWESIIGSYDDGPLLKWTDDGIASDLIISDCNRYNLQTYTHFMTILRLMIAGKTQRILVIAELPVDPLKELFNVYETELWSQVLQFFKAQIPFTGKRWRYLNIELISAIYLYCPARIDDNWLSGNDLTQTIRNANKEELELRVLIESYNERICT